MTVVDIQKRLIELGYSLPRFGADGDFGAETIEALNKALDDLKPYRTAFQPPVAAPPRPVAGRLLRPEWLPSVTMARVIGHWTGGSYIASSLDKEHYHLLINGKSEVVRGLHSIADNVNVSGKSPDDYAAHTLNTNSQSIGVSICCMAGATEIPFDAGQFPMTAAQWDVYTSVVAELCFHYKIAVTPKTVLSHAEVQNNLGIRQRGKWDWARLAFDPSVVGAAATGAKLRREVSEKLKGLK
jgi:hypothetical protein